MNGVLNLNKPPGKSSHDMVYFARRLFGTKKVGHTGTLDPIATGVLPILVGNATKLSELLSAHDKSYRAVLKLGVMSDTMDITGKITEVTDVLPGLEDVKEAARGFVGDIWQTPPVYSAIKQNGKKLYEYAREGIQVNPEPRAVTVYAISCEEGDNPGEYVLDIECSKGTYIRSICHDIGEKLMCGGVMAALCRTRSGDFCISNAHSPEYLEEYRAGGGDLGALLLSTEDVLKSVAAKKMTLDPFFSKLAKNGAEIYVHKIRAEEPENFCVGDRVLMYDCENALFALGEIKDFEAGQACKPVIFVNAECEMRNAK